MVSSLRYVKCHRTRFSMNVGFSEECGTVECMNVVAVEFLGGYLDIVNLASSV